MRAALEGERRAGPRERAAVPAIREAYGIEAVTARIDDLYEELAEAGRRRLWRRQWALRGATVPLEATVALEGSAR
jgi:hypothetical protein